MKQRRWLRVTSAAVAAALTLGLIIGPGGLPLAAQSVSFPSQGLVITEDTRLNLRAGAGAEFAIVGKIDPQTALQVLGQSSDGLWYEVTVVDLRVCAAHRRV